MTAPRILDGFVWTPEEQSAAIAMAREGRPLAAIAAATGRSPAAVKVRLCRLRRDGVAVPRLARAEAPRVVVGRVRRRRA